MSIAPVAVSQDNMYIITTDGKGVFCDKHGHAENFWHWNANERVNSVRIACGKLLVLDDAGRITWIRLEDGALEAFLNTHRPLRGLAAEGSSWAAYDDKGVCAGDDERIYFEYDHASIKMCIRDRQGTVRYIRRDSKPAVFGGHGAPGGLAPQSVAYYIPPPHLKPQKPAPAQHFKPASRHRFEPAPAPAIQQPPHRAQPIEGSQPTIHPPVVSEGENREEPSAANIPANEIPPVDVQPAAENADDAASSFQAPEPVIRPLDDPADPTAPRNLIPGLKMCIRDSSPAAADCVYEESGA